MENKSNYYSGLDWFVATESLNSILNGLIAHYNVELSNMLHKEQTEEYRLLCKVRLAEVSELNRNSEIFQKIETMNFYIDKYGPIIKSIYQDAD